MQFQQIGCNVSMVIVPIELRMGAFARFFISVEATSSDVTRTVRYCVWLSITFWETVFTYKKIEVHNQGD